MIGMVKERVPKGVRPIQRYKGRSCMTRVHATHSLSLDVDITDSGRDAKTQYILNFVVIATLSLIVSFVTRSVHFCRCVQESSCVGRPVGLPRLQPRPPPIRRSGSSKSHVGSDAVPVHLAALPPAKTKRRWIDGSEWLDRCRLCCQVRNKRELCYCPPPSRRVYLT